MAFSFYDWGFFETYSYSQALEASLRERKIPLALSQ